jgi:hypothetical protein
LRTAASCFYVLYFYSCHIERLDALTRPCPRMNLSQLRLRIRRENDFDHAFFTLSSDARRRQYHQTLCSTMPLRMQKTSFSD